MIVPDTNLVANLMPPGERVERAEAVFPGTAISPEGFVTLPPTRPPRTSV